MDYQNSYSKDSFVFKRILFIVLIGKDHLGDSKGLFFVTDVSTTSNHPGDFFQSRDITPGFKPFSCFHYLLTKRILLVFFNLLGKRLVAIMIYF